MRWIVRLVGLVLVVLLLVVGGLLLLPGERIARIAADQVKAQTGRDLAFEGEVSITLWPVLGVETGPVTFGNADWAGPEPMFAAQSLAIGIAAPDLLQGKIRVQRLIAQGPDLRLETHADGRANWEMTAPAPAQATAAEADAGGAGTDLTIARIELGGARVTYAAAGAAPVVLEQFDLALNWPDPAGPADLDLVLRPAGAPVSVTARVRDLKGLLAGAVSPLTAQVKAPGGGLEFDGRANTAGEVAGRIELKAEDTAQVLAALGQGGVAIPQGFGRSANLATELTFTADQKLALRDLVATLDQHHVSGAFDIALAGKPKVTGRLRTGALDLSGGGSASGSGSGNATGGAAGWPTDPIDLSALNAVDAQIAFEADSVDTGGFKTGSIAGTATVDDGRAVLDLARLQAYGGTLAGQVVANARGGNSFAAKLDVTGIELSQVLADTMGISRLTGPANARLDVLGAGGSVDAVMKSLSGTAAFDAGPGRIEGIDFETLIRSGKGNGGTTVFDSLTASFTLKNGDMHNQDLLLSLKNYRADGKGRIGLGARDIDYLFIPVALRANSGEGLAIPLRIQGPWSDPSILPDLSQVIQSKIDLEKEEIEQKAKETLKNKLTEELNVPVDNKQDVEEALKDKLESEAKKGLLKLLGSN